MTSDRSALDLIRASITAHEAKADEAHDADRHRISNEHNAIAAGLRIAEAHILASPDAELEASQRRAVRIQQLLDDTRDRMRKLAAELGKGTHWEGNEPEIGERIIAALHQPKETPDA